MFTARKRLVLAAATVAAGALALAGCSSSSPIDEPSSSAGSDTIVIGSAAFPESEILGEVYAQALEDAGMTVERKFQIGQRDAYMPAMESGEVTLFPEYTGNLLQFFNPDATGSSPDEVYAALQKEVPDSLTVLDQAEASDQDSYTVTQEFADKWGLESIADLSKVTDPLTLGGNAELAQRPYGPSGAKDTYGIDIGFKATGDTTVDDLVAGTVNVADVYTSDPSIQTKKLKVLSDPKGLILPQNIVPLVNKSVADKVADVINPVSAKLDQDALVEMNKESTVDKMSSKDIAAKWLKDAGLLK